jgi:hypothetical protein
MPYFMEYEYALSQELRKKYDVDVVNNEIQWPHMNEYLRSNLIKRSICRLSNKLKKSYKQKAKQLFIHEMAENVDHNRDAYELIICINGHFLTDSFINDLKSRNPKAKIILYLWDDINNLFDVPNIRLFDIKYSFNITDCDNYGLNYLPMYVCGNKRIHQKNKYDIAIIGTGHPDRVEFIKKFCQLYDKQYRIYKYIYIKDANENEFIHNKPLPYEEYLDIISESRALLDIPSIRQKGPTTRFFDALLTDTKVITVNTDIIKYPVYSPNICIVSRENPLVDEDFIYSSYKDVEYESLNVEKWLDKLLEGALK